jgi:hypothetical protein
VVVLGNCLRYQKNDLIPWRFSIPLIAISVPASFFGGSIQISEIMFMALLGVALISTGILMWFKPNKYEPEQKNRRHQIYLNMAMSLLLGFLAGIIGIGGGIFFAPILYLQNVLPSKGISAFSSVFILVNSLAGIFGQLYKNKHTVFDLAFNEYSLLIIAVILGGQIGNYFGVRVFSDAIVRRLTSVLVIYVGIRLIINI